MAKYHTRATWGAADRQLSKDALVLDNYLGRAPTRTSEGLFPLAFGYIEVDTPLSGDEIRAAFEELPDYSYDAENEVVLDRAALKHNPLRNPRDEDGEPKLHEKGRRAGEPMIDNRIPHAVRTFESLPDTFLKVEFVVLADTYSADLADAIRAKTNWGDLPKSFSNQAPSKPLLRAIEAPSREETSSEEESSRREELAQSNGSGRMDPSTLKAQEEW